MITTTSLYLGTLLSTALVAWGYYSNGMTVQALLLVMIGILWLVGQLKWAWIGTLGLALVTVAAIIGMVLGFQVIPTMAGVMFAFISWDLLEFHNRLKQAGKLDDTKGLENRHFLRLGLILVTGLGIVLLTRMIRVRFTFEVGLLLVLAGVWGISLLVGRLRRSE